MADLGLTMGDDGAVLPAADPGSDVRLLRHLERRPRAVALALIVLLAAPFVFSATNALRHDWVPSGDEAVIAVRVHDSLSHHPPLTGLPSTSDLYGGGIKTRHPGPIEFYLLAVPVKLLGPSMGMLFGAGAINLAAVLIALWAVFRRAGPAVATWAAVVLAATLLSTGSAVLTDPISSNMGGFPLLCLAVLAWALACGDRKLLPLTAAVASFAAQQHLAVVPPVIILTGWGLGGFTLTWGRRLWTERFRFWPWVLGSAGVALVLWAPVLVDELTGHPGNLTAVARFARDADRPTLGLHTGATQVLRAAGWPAWVLRRNLTGFDVSAPLGPLGIATGAAVLVAMLVVAIVGLRRRPALARLAGTALVVAVAGALAGASVPKSIEADRINLYRWTWALALCTTLVLGWLVGLAAGRWARRPMQEPLVQWGAVGLSLALIVVAVTTSATADGLNDQRRDGMVFAMDRHLDAAAQRALRDDTRPVVIVTTGSMATLSIAPAINARLADAGIRFQVPAEQADAYGTRRAFDPETAGSALLVVSSFGPLPAVPGQRLAVADLNPDLAGTVDRLVLAVRGQPIVPSSRAPELLTHFLPLLAEAARNRIGRMATDPYAALTSQETLGLLDDGYLAAPTLAHADLVRMEEAVASRTLTVWGDDRVALYQLTLAELRAYRPAPVPLKPRSGATDLGDQ